MFDSALLLLYYCFTYYLTAADKAQAEYTAAYTRAAAVIDAPYVGRDGVEYRINCSTEEFDEQALNLLALLVQKYKY